MSYKWVALCWLLLCRNIGLQISTTFLCCVLENELECVNYPTKAIWKNGPCNIINIVQIVYSAMQKLDDDCLFHVPY